MPESPNTHPDRTTAGRLLRALLAVALAGILAGTLAACATNDKDRLRTETMDQYEALVRWNQFHNLVDYMHPDWLAENPIRELDLSRLQQFQVSQYQVRQVLALDDGSGIDRLVQLHLYHVHTQRARTIQYLEAWRWDEEREGWFLHSGLPDVTAGR